MKNSTIGIVLTLIIVIAGFYIGFKNYKKEGFWWGVLALLLITSSVYIGTSSKSSTVTLG